ncbi:hypothetical protein [Paenibacillus sp. LPE1-1-1.1]|uniref:hypothetical protein n=1 Tax=Paenibacillus sp. LPE1-1-1.1 TaxID=3135230 RepID=UPI0034243FD1
MSSGRVEGTRDLHTQATFQALVDAIIPPVCECTGSSEAKQAPGALQLCIQNYVIKELDFSQFIPVDAEPNIIPLSKSTAILLDIGAAQFLNLNHALLPSSGLSYPCEGLFSTLPRSDRLRAVTLLDHLAVPLESLPQPFQNNPALVQVMMSSINQLTLFGYYSEWFGYGTTRFLPSNLKRIECCPPSWKLVGYPGPSYGYRDFRGFLMRFPHQKGRI